MGWAPKKNGVNDNRILTDIDPEGIRIPTTNCLNRGEACTRFSEGSGSARSKRVTGDVGSKKFSDARNVPVASGNVAT